MKLKLLFIIFLSGLFFSHAQISSIAIVGEAASGWPGDPNNPGPVDINQMTTTDGENWSIEGLTLTASVSGGGLKFRANNDWNLNWGADSFPSGVGLQNGPNITCSAGTYNVTFNSTTGAYLFTGGTPPSTVKLKGSAIDGASEILMSSNNGVNYTISDIALLTGNAQFEINGLLYGSTTFPTGILEEALSIPVTAAEYSSVTLNIETGAYNFAFTPIPINSYISISGSAIGNTSDAEMITFDGVIFNYVNLSTTQGELHFVDSNLSENYGNSTFPEGVAILNGGSIQVPSGTWNVSFNILTKAYDFFGTSGYPTISIVGSGAGGWPGDPGNPGPLDTNQMVTEDGINYTFYALTLIEGEVKFRQDNSWSLNWGNASFPSGIGVQNSSNIIIPSAGTYTVTFNRLTSEYNFGTSNRIAIVGTGAGGWPSGAIGEVDAHQLASTDGIQFRLDDMELTDGEVKFRQNNSWDVFWGGTSLDGTLVLFGPAIQTTAGTYSINLNRLTGDYSLATNVSTRSDFKIYPNPTQNIWNFTAAKEAIETIQIFDGLGKRILTVTPKDTSAILDASGFPSGLYFAKIETANATETVKLMKN